MFKKIIIAAGVIASGVAFSSGTLAATAGLTQSVTKNDYASELFGTGSDATVLTSGATVVLTRSVGGVPSITPGEISDFTFTLGNATFGEAVALGDFVFADQSDVGAVTITKQSGGAVGDTAVVFRVEVTSGSVDTGDKLTLTIDKIKGASILATPATKTVTATASIAGVASTGIRSWPLKITSSTTANVIASSVDEVALTIAAGTDATINVAARADIVAGAAAIDHDADGGTTAARDGVNLSAGTVTLAGTGNEADNGTFSLTDTTGDGGGDVTITVTGTFNDGDLVCIDLDAGSDCDATGEKFTIAGGTATWTTTNAAYAAAKNVYYVANGTSTLKPTDFVTVISIAYDKSTIKVETPVTTTTSTSYSGLSSDGWASAIPASTSSDIANIRVTNHTSAAVTLFAQCYGQDGADLGFHEMSAIAAYATTVLSATDLEAVFGTWSGRATCDFSRSGDITVQTMIRSGGILNNMTPTAGATLDDTGTNVGRK